ncbi:unnamed protein product [Boreogadus saida]
MVICGDGFTRRHPSQSKRRETQWRTSRETASVFTRLIVEPLHVVQHVLRTKRFFQMTIGSAICGGAEES